MRRLVSCFLQDCWGLRFGRAISGISLLTLLALFLLVFKGVAGERYEIKGRVSLRTGEPAAFANIYIKDTFLGTSSDESGQFVLVIPDTCFGKSLIVSFIGYEQVEIILEPGRLQNLDIVLKEGKELRSAMVHVYAKRPVLKTRGLQRDFLSLIVEEAEAGDIVELTSKMAGAQKRDNDSYVYVRGGEFNETKFILDGAYLLNPFLINTGFGGLGSFLDILDTKAYFFSSGGFSAKYTSALSGIVEVKSQDFQKDYQNTVIALSPAGIYGFKTVPLNEIMNLQVAAMAYNMAPYYSYNRTIFSVNDQLDIFADYPRGGSVKLRSNIHIGGGGNLKLSAILARSGYDLRIDTPDKPFLFGTREKNTHHNVLFSRFLAKNLGVESNVAFSTYIFDSDIDSSFTRSKATLLQWNTNANYYLDEKHDIQFGINIHRYFGDINSFATKTFQQNFYRYSRVASRTVMLCSFFADYNYDVSKRISMNIGLRAEVIEDEARISPRMSLFYRPNKLTFKISAGLYNQMQDPNHAVAMDSISLFPQQAKHLMFDTEYKGRKLKVASGVYYKSYKNLPLSFVDKYTFSGNGYTYGLDVRLKYKFKFVSTKAQYTLNASLNKTRKKLNRYHQLVAPDSEVPLSLYNFLKIMVTPKVQVNLIHSYSSGRPYSDAAELLQNRRLPASRSTDIHLSYVTNFHGWEVKSSIIFGNVFQNKNLFGYNYNSDFTARVPQYTGSISSIMLALSFSRY